MKVQSTLILLTQLVTLSNAMAYELISFVNSRLRTQQEILDEVKMQKEDLIQYSCENKARYDLFTENKIQNMAKDSLKIITQNGKTQTFIEGKLFDENNVEITKVKDKFTRIVLKTLSRLETVPETRRLIEELQFSPYPFHIKLGRNSYMANNPGERTYLHGNEAGFISFLDELRPMIDRMPFSQVGYGGIVFWNPGIKAEFIEDDYRKRFVDRDIALAHEMYHAYDGMRGLLDRRFVKSETHEFQPVAEYRAVRMENITRKALGQHYRRYYSDPANDHDPKDMLDDNDEPIIMPTPCIKWL